MFNWGCFSSRGRRDLFFLLASRRMRGRTFLRSRSASYVCSSLPNVGVLVVHPVSMGWVSHPVLFVCPCGCVQHSPCVPWIGRDGFQTTHPFHSCLTHSVCPRMAKDNWRDPITDAKDRHRRHHQRCLGDTRNCGDPTSHWEPQKTTRGHAGETEAVPLTGAGSHVRSSTRSAPAKLPCRNNTNANITCQPIERIET